MSKRRKGEEKKSLLEQGGVLGERNVPAAYPPDRQHSRCFTAPPQKYKNICCETKLGRPLGDGGTPQKWVK